MAYQDNFSFTPNLDYTPQSSSPLKKTDFLKALLDREKNVEKVQKINDKLRGSAEKRAEALKALRDSHEQLGKFVPADQVAPERIGKNEALWAGGLSALGRLVGGSDAMPGIRSGLKAWSQGRNADFAQRAAVTNVNNQQRDQALLAGLKNKADMAEFGYKVADDDYQGEISRDAALERERVIGERMERIKAMELEGRGAIERGKMAGDREAILTGRYDRGEITRQEWLDGMTGVGISKANELKQSAWQKQTAGDFNQAQALTWPEHMANERTKVELSLTMLNKSLEDGRFNDWYRLNDLGIRTTSAQNQIAEQTAEIFDKIAEGYEESARKFTDSSTKYDADIAKVEGQVSLLKRIADSPPSKDPKIEEKRQAASMAYPAKLEELNALKASKTQALVNSGEAAKTAQRYRENAINTRAKLKTYEVSPPPTRKQGNVSTKVGSRPSPMSGSGPRRPAAKGSAKGPPQKGMKWDSEAQDWYWPDSIGVPPRKVQESEKFRDKSSLAVGDII